MDELVLNWDLPDESETPDLNAYLMRLYQFYQEMIDRPRMLREQVPPLVMTQDKYEQYTADLKERYGSVYSSIGTASID